MTLDHGVVASNRVDDHPIEISWRSAELGPEIRRALFRKANPSIKLAAVKDAPEARRESKTVQRPRRRRSNDQPK